MNCNYCKDTCDPIDIVCASKVGRVWQIGLPLLYEDDPLPDNGGNFQFSNITSAETKPASREFLEYMKSIDNKWLVAYYSCYPSFSEKLKKVKAKIAAGQSTRKILKE